MRSFYIGFVLLAVASALGAELENEKALIMLEVEPIRAGERTKRSSIGEKTRLERQSPEVPQDYLNLLQQLQQQQQQQTQQTAATSQHPHQQLIQQLVVSRDGSRQPTATRYVLSPDGRLIDESSAFSAFPQPQQYQQAFAAPFYQQATVQQNPLQSTQPQQLPAAPTATPRPGTRPQISEYARQQQRLLQEFRDAPLRAQIAGVAPGPQPPRPAQPVPTGPNSQSAQVFIPPAGSTPTGQQGLPAPYQDPNNPGIIYTPVPVDAQTYYQQLAQQQHQQFLQQPQLSHQQPLTQQQFVAQFGAEDPRQAYAQAQRAAAAQQQFVYQQPQAVQQPVFYQQQPQQQSFAARHPSVTVLPQSSAAQPQQVQQSGPTQYLIETTKPAAATASQPQQYLTSSGAQQIQYVQQPVQQQAAIKQQESGQQSTLHQPAPGRGLYGPIKPSRSSIYVSRSSTPKGTTLTVSDEVTSEKVPVVRLPPSAGLRTLSKQEIDALVSAGFTVTPIQDSQQVQYVKSKRQPEPINQGSGNHVLYENPQDGVQYQYSPGSSDISANIKTKKRAPASEYYKQESS